MIRWLRDRLLIRHRPLQDRLAVLIAVAVAAAVAVTGVAAYFIMAWSVYEQLDKELVDVGAISSGWLAEDLENMGGVDPTAVQAANATLMLVRSDNRLITMPGRQPTLQLTASELAIARLGQGYSARSGVDSAGRAVRIIAVPLQQANAQYALVLGRQLEPTEAILRTLQISLLVFGGIGAIGAAAIGYGIADSGMEPLRRLNRAVSQVIATNKHTPIEVVGDDEIADLGHDYNRMMKALESSRERQQRLIADAGHELRTPLTSMRTNVELLVADERQGMLPPGARGDILRDVAAQLGEFTTLVGDLVQLSREDSLEVVPVELDLRDVVESALTRVKRRGPGLVWDVEIDHLYMTGEPDALERAITNLLDNAVKFSPPGGTVRVQLEGDRLRISDQGPGIADEDMPHVFERFYRSDHARTTPGSGLGLSIVAQTVQAHGGWVKAGRSAAGGAEFTVRLPGSTIAPEDAAASDAPASSASDAPPRR